MNCSRNVSTAFAAMLCLLAAGGSRAQAPGDPLRILPPEGQEQKARLRDHVSLDVRMQLDIIHGLKTYC